jgi:predicted transcriptional regulator
MKLHDVVKALGLAVRSGTASLEREVTGGYAGDLLSDVIANSQSGALWITMQVHVNIVAVAVLKDLAGIVLVEGREPADETLKKAAEEDIPILSSSQPAFETAGALHAILTKSP